MGRTTNGIIKSRIASVNVAGMRFVKEGAADGFGALAVDSAAMILGVTSELDTLAGDRMSVIMVGNIAPIVYGGTVARGDVLTADAQGRAVATTTTGARFGGTAEVAGVLGDIGSVVINPGIL
jgi:hypothetical protein